MSHTELESANRHGDSLVVLALLVRVPLVLALPWHVVGLVAADVEGDEEAGVSDALAGGEGGQMEQSVARHPGCVVQRQSRRSRRRSGLEETRPEAVALRLEGQAGLRMARRQKAHATLAHSGWPWRRLLRSLAFARQGPAGSP